MSIDDLFDYRPIQEWNNNVAVFGMPTPEGNLKVTEIVTSATSALHATALCFELAKDDRYVNAIDPGVLAIVRLFFTGKSDDISTVQIQSSESFIESFMGTVGMSIPLYSLKIFEGAIYQDSIETFSIEIEMRVDLVSSTFDSDIIYEYTSPPEPIPIIVSDNELDIIELSWSASSGAVSYNVYRSDYKSAFWFYDPENLTSEQIFIGNTSDLFWTDNTLTDIGTKYYWIAPVFNNSFGELTEGTLSPIHALGWGSDGSVLPDDAMNTITSCSASNGNQYHSVTGDPLIKILFQGKNTIDPSTGGCYICYEDDLVTETDDEDQNSCEYECVQYDLTPLPGGVGPYTNGSICGTYGVCEIRTRSWGDAWFNIDNWSSWTVYNENYTQSQCNAQNDTTWPDTRDSRWFGNLWNASGNIWTELVDSNGDPLYTKRRKCRNQGGGTWENDNTTYKPHEYALYRADINGKNANPQEYRFIDTMIHDPPDASINTTWAFFDETPKKHYVTYYYRIAQRISGIEGDFGVQRNGFQTGSTGTDRWWLEQWT